MYQSARTVLPEILVMLTVKDCPLTVGSGVSLVMVEVVSALLMVNEAVVVPLSRVASALPAPAAEARKVAVQRPAPF